MVVKGFVTTARKTSHIEGGVRNEHGPGRRSRCPRVHVHGSSVRCKATEKPACVCRQLSSTALTNLPETRLHECIY